MDESTVPIVIDTGTQEWRAGFANRNHPDAFITPSLQKLEDSDFVQNGVVEEFRYTPKSISYFTKHVTDCLSKLGAQSDSSHILLAVSLKMSNKYRQKLTEALFETFNFKSVFYVSQPLLAAYSSGYSDCLVVDSGYSHTGILALKNLHPFAESERVLPLGGRNIDRYLRNLTGTKLAAFNEDVLRHIKVNYCSIPQNSTKNGGNFEKKVTLPDGSTIRLGEELNLAPEMLFNPCLGGLPDVMPIDQAAIRSALSLDENDAYVVLETVILAGGNTGFPGTASKMQNGIATRTVPRINKRVLRHRLGTEAVWVGGSIIASTQTYPKICITKEAYSERGPIVATERWL